MRQIGYLTFVLLVECLQFSFQWSYQDQDTDDWTEGVCSLGERQSPVDLPRTGPEYIFIKEQDLQLDFYDHAPGSIQGVNDGKTLVLRPRPLLKEKTPRVSSGGLEHKYLLSHILFHWGAEHGLTDALVGSEHSIMGKFFAMEVQFVHYREEFADLEEAVASGLNKSLLIMSVFYKLQIGPNLVLLPLISNIPKVEEFETEAEFKPFPIEDLLPNSLLYVDHTSYKQTKNYYLYQGSQSAPGCEEVVSWLLFQTPVDINDAQMNAFRALRTGEGENIGDNFRVRQVSNMTVYVVDTHIQEADTVQEAQEQGNVLAVSFSPEDLFFLGVLGGRLVVFGFYVMLFVRVMVLDNYVTDPPKDKKA